MTSNTEEKIMIKSAIRAADEIGIPILKALGLSDERVTKIEIIIDAETQSINVETCCETDRMNKAKNAFINTVKKYTLVKKTND